MTEPFIKTRALNKVYQTIDAVQNFNFEAEKGEIIALLGPNGAGKSTLMNMIAGFLSPTSGKIFIKGDDISLFGLKAKAQIGFLPEGSPIYQDMSVQMFLKYMADLRGASKQDMQNAIALADVEDVLSQKIETLSKGYLRRVGFAQSILSNPDILLLDEPTDGLDPNQKENMRALIKQMGKNKAIVISTHLLDEAESVCSRVVIINKGKMMANGTLGEILKQTKTKSLDLAFKKLTTN
ncbi:MAG: ABC transporter ATP-binding protein [Alphaproteobacteria bacterium]|nr:ABC transporter ATP-binding protein [Alphaproteobacteria bacterium]